MTPTPNDMSSDQHVPRPTVVMRFTVGDRHVELRPARLEDKVVLQRLMELYLYDFSEYEGADVDAGGLYGYGYLDQYWVESTRYPFLIRVDGRWAGFALVRDYADSDGTLVHGMAEFFVMRKYRRAGIGRAVACRLFDAFPGSWHVGQVVENVPAQRFWRRVIGEYSHGQFQEIRREFWDGPLQMFVSEGGEKASS